MKGFLLFCLFVLLLGSIGLYTAITGNSVLPLIIEVREVKDKQS